jgi:hypothetical protein
MTSLCPKHDSGNIFAHLSPAVVGTLFTCADCVAVYIDGALIQGSTGCAFVTETRFSPTAFVDEWRLCGRFLCYLQCSSLSGWATMVWSHSWLRKYFADSPCVHNWSYGCYRDCAARVPPSQRREICNLLLGSWSCGLPCNEGASAATRDAAVHGELSCDGALSRYCDVGLLPLLGKMHWSIAGQQIGSCDIVSSRVAVLLQVREDAGCHCYPAPNRLHPLSTEAFVAWRAGACLCTLWCTTYYLTQFVRMPVL